VGGADDARVLAVPGERAVGIAAILLAERGGEVGAADPDRADDRVHPVVLVVGAANESGHLAQAALQQAEEPALASVLLAGEAELVDANLAVLAHREHALVDEAHLEIAGGACAQHVRSRTGEPYASLTICLSRIAIASPVASSTRPISAAATGPQAMTSRIVTARNSPRTMACSLLEVVAELERPHVPPVLESSMLLSFFDTSPSRRALKLRVKA
jgi:hypothetical protein